MRRLLPIALLALLVLLAAGCSTSKPGESSVGPIGTVPATGVKVQAAAVVPAQYKGGDPTAGKTVFLHAGCAGCHTLKDAGSHGNVGPNLDQAKPSLSLAVMRVTMGAGAMPSFKSQLSSKQIADVTAYVVHATGGNATG